MDPAPTLCPLCEHAQVGGLECQVCGRILAIAAPDGAPSEAIPGLETSGQAAGAPFDLGGFEAEPFGGLEQTAFEAAGNVAADRVPDLEATAAASVVVPLEPTPGVESHRAEPVADEAPAALLGTVCRYCRAEALPGERLCGRCGMRLPLPLGPGAAPPDPVGPRLCSCGTPVRGALCPACGARHA